jgi:hypothetical protein
MINLTINVQSVDPKLEKKLKKAVGKILELEKAANDTNYSIDSSFSVHKRPQVSGYVRGQAHYPNRQVDMVDE